MAKLFQNCAWKTLDVSEEIMENVTPQTHWEEATDPDFIDLCFKDAWTKNSQHWKMAVLPDLQHQLVLFVRETSE